MSEENYKYGYKVGPFYRKFVSGDSVWCEVNRDGKGGLWLHMGNSNEGTSGSSPPPIHFTSEEHFTDFCTKLLGYEALENWEEIWKRSGY